MRGPSDVARAAARSAAARRAGKAGDDPGDDRGGDDAQCARASHSCAARCSGRDRRAARGAVNVAARRCWGPRAARVAGAPDASALWRSSGGGALTGRRAPRAATLAAEGALVVAVHAPAAYLFASLARLPRPLDFACAATAAASLHGAVAVLTAVAPDAGLAALLLAVKFGASFAAVALSDETWITHFSTFKLADDALAASQGFSENHAAKFLALSTGLLCLLAPSTVDSALGGGRR
ncbi:transferase [Aureococcus anophagefferens]|nr:transferase [Aureococcus anophagefferens]